MGRPKMPKGTANNVLIAVRVSIDDNKTIQAAIKASKVKKPEWLRNALLSAATEGKSLP